MQKILTILLLAVTTWGYSQSITIKGAVQDPDGLPLEAATVYIRSVKDSTLLDYTITDNKGNWQMKSRGISQPFTLKVSFVGFGTYQKQYESLTKDTDFGLVKLTEKGTELKEVVIESDVPPVRVKKDTLEFDAASFKVRPDSNVQTLLKQLPGVNIDADGKITVNGKEVNQILVNGKPFFDRDGKIALQSLPAELIKKIQVSDYKTKKEELQKKPGSGDNASINLTIDKDKNKGIFGRITAGYGTNDRYEANGLVNYFKDTRKISLLASSNNINASGFSNDDIFDSMGGGRNMMMWTSGDGSTYINGVPVGGGGSGITTTNIIGGNYSDEYFKGFDHSASYFYNNSDNKNNTRTRSETFLTDENGAATENRLINNRVADSRSLTTTHTFNTEFDIKLDSTSTLNFRPKFVRTNSKRTTSSTQNTTDQNDTLLNESDGSTMNDGDKNAFSSTLTYNKVLNKRGRSISAEFSNSNTSNQTAYYNNTNTTFYEDLDGDGNTTARNDNRNQLQKNRSLQDSYTMDLSYTEPVADSVNVEIGARYNWANDVTDNKGFNYNAATANYTTAADSITNYLNSNTITVNPYASFRLEQKKLNITLTGGTGIYNFDNFGRYRGQDYTVNKNYLLPMASARFNYHFQRSTRLSLSYNFNTSFASASQILPIEDVSNALSTTTGNPDLAPAKSHRVGINYNKFDFATRSGFFVYGGATINETQIVNYTEINASGKRNSTYENINGGYSTYMGGNYNKSIKSESGNNLRYNLGLNVNYSRSLGFLNTQMYAANNLGITPNVSLNYDLGEVLSINPSYTYTLNSAKYTNYSIGSAENFVHKASVIVTNYWPKHFVMGNDLTYTYNSQLSAGYKKDFFLWNTSIGYNFYKDQFTFKVKVYDLLNQNLGNSRTITSTGITDVQNTVLKRYAMFSLTWKINNFGNNKKPGQGMPGGGRGMRMRTPGF
ncbi:outer membrane beta-barrel protein [Flavobacterium sp. RHBU_3]|uniref:outer membrane beta-barrel protein n=1 Tax=Flavobacterium sp. RHBU_3 TaxID=3391184 RepID=UPI003984D1CE